MNDPQSWVTPLTRLPVALKPLVMTQKKHYGEVLHPTRWWGRVPFLFWLVALFVGFLERKRARLTPVMRALLMTRVSQVCHCAFCVDANSLRLAVANWQVSSLFTTQERVALAYADAVTATPPHVDDVLKAQMKQHFSDDVISEMTALLAFQNLSARFNAALDIPSQGLCDSLKGAPRA